MKKKLLSLILTLCMICSSCAVLGTTAFAAPSTPTTADGALTADALAAADTAGTGTIDINGPQDWAKFVEAAQTLDFAGVTINLNTDITYNSNMVATDIGKTTDLSGYEKWTPIPSFSGTLNGGEHTISGLCTEAEGFVAVLNGGATIQDLTFTNCGVRKNGGAAGVLAGTAQGSGTVVLSNIAVKSSVVYMLSSGDNGGLIGTVEGDVAIQASSCTNEALVDSAQNGGGMIGQSFGGGKITLRNCINTGTIAVSNCAGGMVACVQTAELEISGCVNKGYHWGSSKAGGFVAYTGGSLTITDSLNEGKIESNTSPCVSGFVGYACGDTVTLTRVMNKGEVNVLSQAGKGGGFIAEATSVVTIKQAVNQGKIYAAHKSSRIGGLIGRYQVGTGTFEECLSLGDICIDQYVNGGAFIGDINKAPASNDEYLLFRDCYYWQSISKWKGGSDKSDAPIAVGFYAESNGAYGNIRTVYTAKDHDDLFIGGTDNAGVTNQYLAITKSYNTPFTDGATGAMIAKDSTIDLNGEAGVAFLSKAGFEFGKDWFFNDGLPVPTTLALGDQSLDETANVVYKGLQTKLGGDDLGIRLIAGLDSLEFVNTGYELSILEDGETKSVPTEKTTTNLVYTSLNTYISGTEGAQLSDPITAEMCGCAYLSAITINELPKDKTLSLIVKPFVTDTTGDVTYGTAVIIAISNGTVVAQYTY